MKRFFLFLLWSVSPFLMLKTMAETITLEKLLEEIVSFEAAVYYPEYTCFQESSYDRRSISPHVPGWWANDDGGGYIRTDIIDGRTEKVLFDQSSPGVITRMWITTQNKQGTLRFYFDGQATPGWVVPAYDMVRFGVPMGEGLCQPHTSYNSSLNEKGGSTFFMPIPYAKSCKITLEEPVSTSAPPRYYGINYRRYPKNTAIETFSSEVVQRASGKIAEVNATLLNVPTFAQGTVLQKDKRLSPSESVEIDLPQGECAVRSLLIQVELENPELYEQTMRELILETEFDSKKTSWVPLSDFSGGGMGAPYVKSWYLDADGKGKIVSRWVMPYKDSGKISLTNYSIQNLQVSITLHSTPFEWNDQTLYFHCSWKQELDIPLVICGGSNNPSNGYDWSFALIEGKGVYRGDALSLFNYSPRWYGEGDEKIWVDDDVFPSHFGTGTEDYYNSSWAPVIPFHTPFGGAPRADKASSKGYNTFFRTRNLDAIPFRERFSFDIEMLSWDPGSVDYATTIYWYGDYQAKAKNLSGLEEAKRELPESGLYKISDCIEFERHPVTEQSPSFETNVQDMTPFSGGEWSGEYQLLFKNGQIGDYVVFRFENLNKVTQRLTLYLTKANDFGIVSFTVNGQLSSTTFDGYAASVVHSGPLDIGTYMPDENGVIELKITLVGINPNTQGYRTLIGLDCIQIMEAPEAYRVSGGIEFEQITPSDQSSELTVKSQEMFSNYPGGRWSNKSQMVALNGKVGSFVEYVFDKLSPVEHDLVLYATKGNDFGILSFSVNGEKTSKSLDGYSPFVTHSGPIHLGRYSPDEQGFITFRAELTGTNSKSGSPRYVFGLDCLRLSEAAQPTTVKAIETETCTIQLTPTQLNVRSDKAIGILSLYNLNGMLVAQEKKQNFVPVRSQLKGIYLLEILWEQANDKSIFKIFI